MQGYERANAHLQKAIEIYQFLVTNASEEERIEIGYLLFQSIKELQKVVGVLKDQFRDSVGQWPIVLDGADRGQVVITPQEPRRVVTDREAAVKMIKSGFLEHFRIESMSAEIELPGLAQYTGPSYQRVRDRFEACTEVRPGKPRITFKEKT